MTHLELEEQLEKAVEIMKDSDGCYEIPLEGNLSLFVGWTNGYDPEDETCIHAKDEPWYCLNAGIKVNTSDDMKTDYEYMNSPYWESGDVWMTDISLTHDDNYMMLATYFLAELSEMLKFDIDDHGKILNANSPE